METQFRYAMLALVAVLLVIGLFQIHAKAQAKQEKPAKYEPTELQMLKLQVRQKDYQLSYMQLRVAQQAFQENERKLNEESKAVITENHWPDSVQFDAGTLTFHEKINGVVKPASGPATPQITPASN